MNFRDFFEKSLPILESAAPLIFRIMGRPGLSDLTIRAIQFLEREFGVSWKDGLDDAIAGHRRGEDRVKDAEEEFEEWMHGWPNLSQKSAEGFEGCQGPRL